MSKILTIIAVCSIVLLPSCIKNQPTAKVSDLSINGLSNRILMLDGTEGNSTTFTISKANYDWSIVDYKGFSCIPNSGSKIEEGNLVTITATPFQSNNSADTVRLSSLNFKMLATRFVGISAYQLPQIILHKGDIAYINATIGSTSNISFISKGENIELVCSGDITASLSNKNHRHEYTITITSTNDNISTENQEIGTIGFNVNGVMQEGKITVLQSSAITFDRSSVLLPGVAGGENIFKVDSDFEVEVSTTSQLFTIIEGDNNTFRVKANSNNTTTDILSLGEINVALKETPNCNTSIEVKQRIAKAPQTIIAYFIGTALRTYFNTNATKILEALSADIQGDAQIIIISTDSSTDATMYELRYDKQIGKAVKEQVKEISLSVPYDAELFEDVIATAIGFAPAEKYSLIIGSHGHGWTPKNFSSTASAQLMKMGCMEPTLLWQKPAGSLTRHIGDSGYTIQYDISEIAEAISANKIKLEYILFDSCYMGNIESAYELRNSANYIIGSPCEVMAAGFPYDKVIPNMLLNNGTAYDIDKICYEYVDYYRTSSNVVVRSACVSAVCTNELASLANSVKAANAAAQNENFQLENIQFFDGIHSSYNPVHIFYDLGDLVRSSCSDSSIVDAFNKQLSKCVTSIYHTDSFYSDYDGRYHQINSYCGVTTSAKVTFCEEKWKATAWYKDTH